MTWTELAAQIASMTEQQKQGVVSVFVQNKEGEGEDENVFYSVHEITLVITENNDRHPSFFLAKLNG